MTVDAADKSAVVLRLTPQSGVGQEVKQSHLSIEPQVNLYEFHDAFGNLLQRIMLGPDRSIITSTCTVDTPDEIASDTSADFTLIQNLPDDVLHYVAEPILRIGQDAETGHLHRETICAWLFTSREIRSWIFRKVRYKYGVSNSSTSVIDTAKQRAAFGGTSLNWVSRSAPP